MLKHLLSFACLTLILQGCINSGMQDDHKHPQKLPRELTASEQQLIHSSSRFSYDIFRHMVQSDEDKNVFVSPLSISMALGMTLNGAVGGTKAGIQGTLDMSEMELQQINQSYQSLIKLLVDLDPKVKMNIANSIWSRQGFSIKQSFKDTLKTYFNAQVDELNSSDLSAANEINQWVSNQTNGNINQLIDKIPPQTVLYLINAVCFKGDWRKKFDADKTMKKPFHLDDGSTVQVDMMHREEAATAFYSSQKVKMAELAYGDSLYNMTIAMPADPSVSIDDFIDNSLTASNLEAWTGQLYSAELSVELPKFESSYKAKLNDVLKAMGMSQAFDGSRANFSKINPDFRLFISRVLHKATIKVDEEGSEASAATSVGISFTSAGPQVFKINRPFVYMIRERISGTVLFIGVMRNPNR